MRREVRQSRWRPGLAAALCLACAATVLAAEEPEPEPPAPLAQEMATARDLIVNARAKLRANVVGLGTSTGTPAQRCCSPNLERLLESLTVIHRTLGEFAACHEQDDEMVTQVGFATLDLQELARALDAFAKARDRRAAFGALDAVTRAYLNFRESTLPLRPCGSADDAASPKKRKKKSRKRDQPRDERGPDEPSR